jgi:MFS family permease
LHLLLSHADIRRVWLIGMFSGVIRWLEFLAFGIYVYDVTGSAFLVSTFTMLRFVPFAVFGAVTGGLVDRFGHQNVLRYSLALMFVTSSVMAWLAATDQLALWHLAVAIVLGGFYWTTDFPARRNLIGLLAGPELLSRILSLDAAGNTMTRAAGPLFGGLLMASLGVTGILELSMGLYLISTLLAFRLTTPGKTFQAVASKLLPEIWAGFKYAATRRDILAAFSITLIFNLFGFPFTTLIPVIGKQTLGLSADSVGMIAALEGVGAMAGALIAGNAKTIGNIWATYMIGVFGSFTGILAIGMGQDVPLVVVGILFAGFGGGFFATSQVMIIYRLSPPDQRSRMFGILTLCIGIAPVGFSVLGYMADWLGSGTALLIMSAEGFVAMSLFWLVFRRSIRASEEY